MRSLCSWVVVLMTFTSVWPQAHSETKTWGHFFTAPGVIVSNGSASSTLHFGAGVEGLLVGGLGFGTEIGYLAPWKSLGDGIGVFSPGVLYAFERRQKVVPFVTGGYTLFFRQGTSHGVFFGGGVNYWLGKRLGLRFEARDQVMIECSTHVVEGRVALLIR